MRHHLKWPKQPSLITLILLFPVMGLLDLKDNLKRDTINEFTINWVIYILSTILWCLAVGATMYVICTGPLAPWIPVTLILGIVFLLVGIPRIIYKLANRKPRK